MLHYLDVRTLIFVLTLLAIVQAVVLLYMWRVQPQYKPANYWGIGSLLYAGGLLLIGLRDLVPVSVSVVMATLLLLTGWLYFCAGIIRAADVEPPWRSGGVLVAATLAFNSWYLVVQPNFAMRVLGFCLATVAIGLFAARACLSVPSGTRTATTLHSIGVALLIHSGSNVWRTLGAFEGTVGGLLSAEGSQVQYFFVGILLLSVVAILLVLLAAQKLQDEIAELARQDVLTQAFNRRALDEFATREWARSLRHGYPLSFLMLDIDHFKRYNDEQGHKAGDEVLTEVSLAAQRALRPEDVWCRYGGEEFIAMLPNTSTSQALGIAERLRTEIQSAMSQPHHRGTPVTVSIGVAERAATNNQWSEIVEAADRAMYRAKSAGRDRVVAEEDMHSKIHSEDINKG